MTYLKQAKKKTVEMQLELTKTVSDIIAKVRLEGDSALTYYNTKFDNNPSTSFRVSQNEIDEAYKKLSELEISDIKQAHENIKTFATAQRSCMLDLSNVETVKGSNLGHKVLPINSALCYVPGGSYPLFSTALMLATPARVAGVSRVVCCSPTDKTTGKINPKTLVAMDIAGADEIYALGGAHAIAGFSYGTEQITPVDIIVGPGNSFVTEAKRQCYGQVGIDFVAGPSEVLVIADHTADPEIIAADILAQSEHDKVAAGILITTDEKIGLDTIKAVKEQLKTLDTAEIARVSWENNGEVILVDTLEQAIELEKKYAPEHLEIVTERNEEIANLVDNYGSLFIGQDTGEVFGDYASGTNHTLPTLRAGRYTGGVWVGTFVKVCTYQSFSKSAMQEIAPLVSRMAHGEGLTAHARGAEIRLEKSKK